MKRIVLTALLALLSTTAVAIDSESFADPVMHARYRKLTQEFRCLQCQNESIRDSNATLAVDLRRELRAMLLAGKTDEEIIRFLTDRYGDYVLYKPPFAARTVVLWLAPGVAVLSGLLVVGLVIRRRANKPFDDAPVNETAGADS